MEFSYNLLGIRLDGDEPQEVEGLDTCDGEWDDITSDFDNTWSTQNPSIATVNAYGVHAGGQDVLNLAGRHASPAAIGSGRKRSEPGAGIVAGCPSERESQRKCVTAESQTSGRPVSQRCSSNRSSGNAREVTQTSNFVGHLWTN